MAAQVCLPPHEPSLKVLHTHDTLRAIKTSSTVGSKDVRVLQVSQCNVDRRRRFLLETKLPAPRHVLNGKQRAVGDYNHIEVAVTHEDALGCVNDLREDVLDWVKRKVARAFWAASIVAAARRLWAADEDGVDSAFGPVHVVRCVNCGLDVAPVEVCTCARGRINELCGKAEDVPEQRALLVDFVDIKARIEGQGSIVDHAKNITIGLASVVEEHRRLNA